MAWTEAIALAEFDNQQRQVVKLKDKSILLIQQDGKYYACDVACPHFKLPLTKGEVCDDTITCPWHKSAFDLTTGDVKDWSPWPPVVGKVLGCMSRKKALNVYPTKVEANSLWVEV